MSQKVKEKAEKFYPDNWSKEYLKALVEKGALTQEEYKEITGEDRGRAGTVARSGVQSA